MRPLEVWITKNYPVIERDRNFIEKRRKFYEESYSKGEPPDAWHKYSQRVINSTTRQWFDDLNSPQRKDILNAGSGGNQYGIKASMVHLDLVKKRISEYPNYIVGDVSNIPATEGSFDTVLCVGSVLNYANPILAIQELRRVLRPGGLLIVEYERSGSLEYRLQYGVSSCLPVTAFYGNGQTQLWAYGDEFIDGILALYRFKIIREKRFHGLSSIVLSLTNSPQLASRFLWKDSRLANLWPIRSITSNRMLAVKKLAD